MHSSSNCFPSTTVIDSFHSFRKIGWAKCRPNPVATVLSVKLLPSMSTTPRKLADRNRPARLLIDTAATEMTAAAGSWSAR
jgi:hypothetical protein